jgi:DNA segregation ATPase FtsK/SpoIIIE, S-DNA-T family
MAASSVPLAEQGGIAGFLVRRASEALGAVLILAALILALALLGHDPNDPSLNHATVEPAANPLGYAGATIADFGLQMFGYAIWIPVVVLPPWGLRLILGAPFDLSWMRIVALPPAMLASAGWLATFAIPTDWPYPWRGLGGAVGDLLLHHLEWLPGPPGYPPVALTLALACLGFALWAELWLLGKAAAMGLLRLLRGAPEPEQPRWAEAVDQRLGDRRNGRQPPRRRLLTQGFGVVRAMVGDVGGRLRVPSLPFGRAPGDAGALPPAMRRRPTMRAEVPAPQPPAMPEQAAAPARAAARPMVGTAARPAADAELVADSPFKLPPLRFLAEPRTRANVEIDRATLTETAQALEKVLDDFGVRGEIVDVRPGPVVTLYELEPAPGTRAARVISLADDIARSLCAMSVRVAVVPGRNVIGIELPNEQREIVYLRDLLSGPAYEDTSATLTLALGKDIGGEPIVVDLARMPHLLIAGTTGSGKSVAINAMILSLLYRLPPDQCKLIMIDPKVIELSVYEGIPHLLAPVVTEPQKAVIALKWVVREMDDRYRLMSHLGVRDIAAYNRRIGDAMARGEQLSRRVQTGFEPGTGVPIFEQQLIKMMHLPLIVVVVDEVADLMLTAGKEIEAAIQRLSQKARAAGIHLIVATQRPSVDVLTGVIKANLPSRISFRVSSKIDSRTILGEPGAEQLLGQGDLLYMMPGERVTRIHGPLVTDEEVERVVAYLREQGEPEYLDSVTDEAALEGGSVLDVGFDDPASNEDAQYAQAVQIVAREGKASTSFLQRKMRIGYNSAARLIERMESDGHISHPDHVGRRQVLMERQDGAEAQW